MGRKEKAALVRLLGNWNTLNARLMELGEDEVGSLLEAEKAGQNRISFVLRLHSRLTKLRRERERRELARS